MKSIEEIIIRSLEYEYSLDLYHNMKQDKYPFIFRPYGRLVKTKIGRTLCLIQSLFALFVSPALFLCRSMLIRYKLSDEMNSGIIYFISSEKARSILCQNMLKSKGISLSPDYGKKASLSFAMLLTYISILFKFFKRFYQSPWYFKSCLLIMEMMAVYEEIDALKVKKIIMTNQLDRWAMLLSLIAKEKDVEIELYQHGVVTGDYKPDIKLPILNKLYCYNKYESDFFSHYIVDKIKNIDYIVPTLNLYPVDGNCNVLLVGVGSRILIDLEYEAAAKLSKIDGTRLFFKPHPVLVKTFDYSQLKKLNLSMVATGAFPKVDILIHLGSTLALEYKNSIPEVIIYEFIDQEGLHKTVSNLKKLLS